MAEQLTPGELLDAELYRALFEQSPDGILVTDENGKLLAYNEAAHRDLGYSREEFEHLELAAFISVEDPTEAEQHRRRLMEHGRTEFELSQEKKSGATRSVLVTTQKLMLAGRTLLHTTWHDTSACKGSQEELSQSIRQLEEEKTKTEAIMDAIGEGISIRDRDYRLIYQNQAIIDIVGRHIGELCYQAIHGRDQICDGCPVALTFQDGKIHTGEVCRASSHGQQYLASTASPIRDASGNIIAAVELIRNITEKKWAEQALQEANAKLEALLNAIPDMVLFKDAHGRHLVVNQAVEQALGLPRQEILGKTNEEVLPAEAVAMCRASEQEAIKARRPVHCEESMITPAGKALFLDTIKAPIHDEQNRLTGVVMVSRDITERKRAEEQVRASEKRLRDITSNLGVGVYLLDERGKIVFTNPMAEQLWGWSLEELREQGVHELVHHHLADGTPLPREECEIIKVIESGRAYTSTDEVFTRKDGTVFPVSVTATPLLEEGRVVATVTAFRDITAEKKLEAELLKIQKLESVGILAGGIAHDFNNLLQAILGSVSLAKLDLEKQEMERVPLLLKRAEDASEAARELSFRLLTFAKGGDPVKTITSVEDIVRKAVSLSLSGSSIVCDIDLPQDLPPAEVDPGQMMQVFTNILINAKEAMPRGGMITIRGQRMPIAENSVLPLREGDYLHISVQDTGCGIPEENLSRIFDPYFSIKGMSNRKGSGLGLSICLAIVRKHGGHLSVESKVGEGATFHVHLAASSKAFPDRHSGAKEQPAFMKKRILFMDDDDEVRQLGGEMIASLGYEVQCVRHGEEAVAVYRQAQEAGRPFAGVVLDLTVKGGLGGDLAAAALRQIDPQVKTVISSGYTDNPVVKHFKDYGFNHALPKPFTVDQLKELLTRL